MSRVLRQAGLLVAFGLPFVGALECAIRVEQKVLYGAPLLGPYTYDSALYEEDALGVRGKPHGRFEKWELNNVGLRGPEVAVPKPRDVVRVATVGASETFGLFETAGNEWPRQLEREARGFAPHVEVLNASRTGIGMRSRIEFLETRILPLEPDIVLLMLEYSTYVGVVRAAESATRRLAGSTASATEEPTSIEVRPRVLKKTRDAVMPRLPGPVRKTVQESLVKFRVSRARRTLGAEFGSHRAVLPAEKRAFESDVIRVFDRARSERIDVAVLIPALRLDETALIDYSANFPYIHEEWIHEAIEVFPSIARRVAQQYGVPVIDLAPAVDGREEELMMDMFHFNDEGARAVADRVAPVVSGLVRARGQMVGCRNEGTGRNAC